MAHHTSRKSNRISYKYVGKNDAMMQELSSIAAATKKADAKAKKEKK